MRGAEFDELAFFRAIADSGAQGVLIGRRAARPKDLEDIRLLTLLRDEEGT